MGKGLREIGAVISRVRKGRRETGKLSAGSERDEDRLGSYQPGQKGTKTDWEVISRVSNGLTETGEVYQPDQ